MMWLRTAERVVMSCLRIEGMEIMMVAREVDTGVPLAGGVDVVQSRGRS